MKLVCKGFKALRVLLKTGKIGVVGSVIGDEPKEAAAFHCVPSTLRGEHAATNGYKPGGFAQNAVSFASSSVRSNGARDHVSLIAVTVWQFAVAKLRFLWRMLWRSPRPEGCQRVRLRGLATSRAEYARSAESYRQADATEPWCKCRGRWRGMEACHRPLAMFCRCR